MKGYTKTTGRTPLRLAILGVAAFLALSGAVHAQDRREERRMHEGFHRGFVEHERFAFHQRDVHLFTAVELTTWRGGYWRNTCFGGRCGWWWFAGGQWFFYDAPVYPYPLFVSEVAYEDGLAPVAVAPAPVVAAPAPAVTAPVPATVASLPPPQPMWYYCDKPTGYYPYIATCPSGFRAVPAQPR